MILLIFKKNMAKIKTYVSTYAIMKQFKTVC